MLDKLLTWDSPLEEAFLRWVCTPAFDPAIAERITPQAAVAVNGHRYRVDYEIAGAQRRYAIELDGYAYHSDRPVFTYDRLRQNDLVIAGCTPVRFSYDAIFTETVHCVKQLQDICRQDPLLARYCVPNPTVVVPPLPMSNRLLGGLTSTLRPPMAGSYFAEVRRHLSPATLRTCQQEAWGALANYYGSGAPNAACVMAVGAGKTVLGVLACLGFAERRALIITPGNVIKGTFDRALDPKAPGNVLYGLPDGPLIPGCPPPRVLTLDRQEGSISRVSRPRLLEADILLTNFHALGDAQGQDALLGKLGPTDIDFIVVDEAHIAAAPSYQRVFAHFAAARTLLMSACFQRVDGKPIEADVVYRYRLLDAIMDGNAKELRLGRYAPEDEATIYEVHWPDGRVEEIIGREALLEAEQDERRLALITAKSTASIRAMARWARVALDRQAEALRPIKPRVLFSALGERHAAQIARVASEEGIPTAYLHYSMHEAQVRGVRARFEQDSGDLQGIVQLKMLGQGYDFPPIAVVVPMRPYGSFAEFYQFIGRGIRVIRHPQLGRGAGDPRQSLDVIYHAEMGLDEHLEELYRENDMDPKSAPLLTQPGGPDQPGGATAGGGGTGDGGAARAPRPEIEVVSEQGTLEERILHDRWRVEQRRSERERESLAARYADYAGRTATPIPFEQFVRVVQGLQDGKKQ